MFVLRPSTFLMALLACLVLGSCGDKEEATEGSDDGGESGSDGGTGDDTDTGDDADADADADGDGVTAADGDCDDTDPLVYPGADDAWYDGLDANCDGLSDYDQDGDGVDSAAHGGTDCDDEDATTFPGAEEVYGDGIDQDCDGVADVADASCTADFTLTLPDGTTVPFDGCTVWSLEAGFEFDPDDPPEVRSATLSFSTTTEADFDCSITVQQPNICGPAYYDQAGTTELVTLDCSGVEDDYEGSFVASSGYVRFDTLDGGAVPGSFAGDPLATAVAGHLHVVAGDIDVAGDFSVSLEQLAGDGEEVADCAGSNGDADGDGGISPTYDGDDCNDDDPNTFMGAAAVEGATSCMTDGDGDGYGATTPAPGVDAGTDCNDEDPAELPGAVAEASATQCMTDADGDGFGDRTASAPYDAGTDCNDEDSAEFPGAVAEASSTECMVDVDGDGYGDGTASAPYDPGSDCNDSEAAENPAATEICFDAIDNDCSGDADGGDAVDATTWYLDADADGYGLTSSPQSACRLPSGYAAVSGDCDDTNADLNPETEVCDAADTDEDCDGLADDDDTSVDATGFDTFYADTDSDGYGGTTSVAACDAPSGHTAVDGDCDDTDATVSPAEVEVCNDGLDNDCDGSPGHCAPGDLELADADVRYDGGTTFDSVGYSVSGAGDVNGDGFDDLFIGANGRNTDGGSREGAVFLVLGSLSPGDLDVGSMDATYTGQSGDYAGTSVAGVGDVDGDGFDDLLTGAPFHSNVANNAGAAYLVLGSASPLDMDLDSADALYAGESALDIAGTLVAAAGDVNGDGLADLLIAARGHSNYAGATYLVLGSASPGDLDLASADAVYTGEGRGEYAGAGVASAGDVDGDGLDDILIGTWEQKAYLVLGSGSPADLELGSADATYTSTASGSFVGTGVAGAGDVNGDGLDDILIGDIYNDDGASDAGAAHLVLGSASPTDLDVASADARYTGEASDDYAGNAVASAGDVDGDGFDDMLIGATSNDDGGNSAGAAYLVLGSATPSNLGLGSADAQYTGEGPTNGAGSAITSAGDIDGDGLSDILLGVESNNADGAGAGAAYLIFGRGESW